MAQPSSSPRLSLEQRVVRFLDSRPGAVNIEHLKLTSEQRKNQKADYFLENRTVVCELKSLHNDMKEKIDGLLAPVLKSQHAPVFYGEWELEKILRPFPDGEAIKRKIFEAVTSAVWRLFRKANDQIRITKTGFGLPQAGGVLILTNDLVSVLSPQVLGYRLNELFGRKEPDGRFSYPEIEAVWLLTETHLVDIGQGRQSVISLVIHREDNSPAVTCLDRMQAPWAAANGMPMMPMKPELLETLQLREVGAAQPSPETVTRQQSWVLEYRRNPYLRNHSVSELQDYFAKLSPGLTAGLLKGATPHQRQLSYALMSRFSHFLEELRERGLDMKSFSPGLQAMGASIMQGEPLHADPAAISAAAETKAHYEVGRYYTNKLGKHYRCLKVDGTHATILLIDMAYGKTLEAVIRTPLSTAPLYWPILDVTLLAALEKRYARWAAIRASGRYSSTDQAGPTPPAGG